MTDSYDYEAFGKLINKEGNTSNNYLYTGEQYDAETQNYYLRARYFSPSIGRFTQQDTYMGNNQDPITLHKYLYANANPSNMIDPSGNVSMMSLVNTIAISTVLAGIKSYDNYLSSPDIYNNFLNDVTIASFINLFLSENSNLYKYFLRDPSGMVDMNDIPLDDDLYYSMNTINYPDIFTYASHGAGGWLKKKEGRTLEDIANKAKLSGKHSILLLACHQRKIMDTSPELLTIPSCSSCYIKRDIKDRRDIANDAQTLANLSGLPVIFSINYVRVLPYITAFSFHLPWNNPWDIAYPIKGK